VHRLTYLAFALGLQLVLASCATPPETGTNCELRPSCLRYLKKIQKNVYREWKPTREVQSGKVRIEFRLDAQGRFRNIRVVQSDSEILAASCAEAMQNAAPNPPPESLAFMTDKKIVATFEFKRGSP
jgi:TonB family protein